MEGALESSLLEALDLKYDTAPATGSALEDPELQDLLGFDFASEDPSDSSSGAVDWQDSLPAPQSSSSSAAKTPLLDSIFSDEFNDQDSFAQPWSGGGGGSSWSGGGARGAAAAAAAKSELLEAAGQGQYHSALRGYKRWAEAVFPLDKTAAAESRGAFDAALAACARGGLGPDAERVLRDLETVSGGLAVRPEDWEVVLEAIGAGGDGERGLRLLRDTRSGVASVLSSEAGFSALLKGLLQPRNFNEDGYQAVLKVMPSPLFATLRK